MEKGGESMERKFANKKAEIAYNISSRISEIAEEIEPEKANSAFKAITFTEQKTQGRYAIFMAGTVIGTHKKGVFAVPERTAIILDRLGIPFEEVED